MRSFWLPLLLPAMLVPLATSFLKKDLPSDMIPKCSLFSCRSGKEAVPHLKSMRFESPGCSGFGMNMFVMSGGEDEKSDPLVPCCDRLHACWQTCSMPKSVCSAQFQKCNAETCAALPGEAAGECLKSAQGHEMMASLSGCPKYDDQQRAACECVAAEAASASRTKALRRLYKSTACKEDAAGCKAKLAKAEGLVAKYSTPTKFAGLLSKLVAKYPKFAVKRVKDKQAAWMEETMRQAKQKDPGPEEEGGVLEEGEEEREDDDNIEHIEL